MLEQVILVDEQDAPLGTMEKMEAHRKGLLHRAFSVFVFTPAGELILQRRAAHKYHSPGLWTNTCCSHPRDGEEVEAAAHRRLVEEMGFDTEIKHAFSFIYKQQVGELIEHELDHVFVGEWEGEPKLNPEETDAWKAMSLEALERDVAANPEHYTVWFRICLDQVLQHYKNEAALLAKSPQ